MHGGCERDVNVSVQRRALPDLARWRLLLVRSEDWHTKKSQYPVITIHKALLDASATPYTECYGADGHGGGFAEGSRIQAYDISKEEPDGVRGMSTASGREGGVAI